MSGKKILIIVDVQKDFCPGGSLACENGNNIVPLINERMRDHEYDLIVATQDWHPPGHCSFASSHDAEPFTVPDDGYPDMVWPDHCIAGTEGAELHDDLDQTKIDLILRKGMDPDVDSYSALADNNGKNPTVLTQIIDSDCSVHVCGIATEVCVRHTISDITKMIDGVDPKNVIIIANSCAAVNESENKKEIRNILKDYGISAVRTFV